MSVSELVRREVQRQFSPSTSAEVMRVLAETPIPFLEAPSRDRDRVQLAMLVYGDRDLERVRAAAKMGAKDWRDLLVMTGLADENWTAVLRAAGYAVP